MNLRREIKIRICRGLTDAVLYAGGVVAALAFFIPLKTLAELVNIGTLFAFILVAIGVLVLRRSQPDLERPFRVPFVPVIPILSVLASFWLMLNLQTATWLRFAIWMAVGFVVYFTYSVRHSRVRRQGDAGPPGPGSGSGGSGSSGSSRGSGRRSRPEVPAGSTGA